MFFFSGIFTKTIFFNAHAAGAYRFLVGKPEGTKPLEIPRRRWEDNIKMDLQKVGRGFGQMEGCCKRGN